MKNKKFLIGILSLCCTLSCAFGTACYMGGNNNNNNNNNNSVESSTQSSESSTESSVEQSTESSVEESTESSESSEEIIEEIKAEVVLSEKEIQLEVYDEATLTATVFGSESAVVWSSSNAAVASVSANGSILAISEGTADIIATVDDVTAVCKVTVKAPTTAPYIKLASTQAYLNVGGEYKSEVKALWKDVEITEAIEYSWSVVEGEATDVVEITVGKNEISLKGLKAGSTVLRVSADIRNVHVSQDLAVTVYENDVAIVAEEKEYIPQKGYYSLSLATVQYEEYNETMDLAFSVYENGVKVEDAQIEWVSSNEEIIVLEENKIKSVNVGSAEVVGTCTVNEVTVNVVVRVGVEKPVLILNETVAPVEVQNLSDVTLQSEILGSIEHVWMFGKDILQSVAGTTMTFNKDMMPTYASQLGEQTIRLETNRVFYDMPLTVYTMVINDKAELDSMVEIAKANAVESAGIWDGYFLLGNDIDYNDAFKPMTSHNHLYSLGGDARANRYNPAFVGFRGIFDGQGYNIDGLEIGVNPVAGSGAEAGIFGVLHRDGIVRNVSFTNAVMRENSGFIAASGGGLVENVSVSYKQIGGLDEVYCPSSEREPRIMSTFFSTHQGVTGTACVRNCFIDVSQAKIFVDEKQNAKYSWSSVQLAGRAVSMESVIVICPNEMLAEESGSIMTYTSYQAFANDVEAAGEFSSWNEAFWTNINGIPFTVNLVNKIDKDAEIDLSFPEFVFAGRQSEVTIVGDYTKIDFVGDHEGVTYNNGYVTVNEGVQAGTVITMQVSSYLNDQVKEKSFTVQTLTEVTIEQAEPILLESTATELDLSVGAEYNGEKATVYAGNRIAGSGEIVDGKIAIDASLIANNGYGETSVQVMSQKGDTYNIYDLKVFYVTKIITKAEDLSLIAVPKNVYAEGIPGYSINGYFILGNDIDCTGMTTDAGRAYPFYEVKAGFRGTFDGNGKTISNLTVTTYGLFGHIGEGAVIKNVTFDNVTYTGQHSTALLAFSLKKATLQNITVNVIDYKNCPNPNAFAPEEGLLASRYLENSTVENVTIHAEGFWIGGVLGRVVPGNNYFNNVVIYADGYDYIADDSDDLAKFKPYVAFPEGITFYTGLELIVNNEDFTAIGDKYVLRLATNKVAGSNDITEYALDLAVEFNDEIVEGAVFNWTYDNEVISIENNVIKSVGVGKTTVVGTYTHTDGSEVTITVDVEVMKPIIDVEVEQTETLYLESISTEINLSVGEEHNGDTASVYYGGVLFGSGEIVDQKLAIDLSALNIQEANELRTFEIEVITENGGVNYRYMLTVSYVTKLIAKASDFDSIRVTVKYDDRNIVGYYLMVADVDFNGVTVTGEFGKDWSGTKSGFRGVLEGNNHKISNLTVGAGGIFGQVGDGAVIRNITFDKISYSYENSTSVALIAKSIRNATLENITVNVIAYGIVNVPASADSNYVEYSGGKMFIENGLLASRWLTDNVISNVTINAQGFDLGRLLGRHSQNNVYTDVTIYGKSYVDIGCDYGTPETAHTELPEGITFIPDSAQA